MDEPNNYKPYLCKLDGNDCVSLINIIKSFNTPVSEEHAWALCYQCAKCFKNAFEREPNRCRVVKRLEEVRIHKDGFIHPSTIINSEEIAESHEHVEKLGDENDSKSILKHHVIASLGYIVFQVLDFGIDEDEERSLNPELESLIKRMIASFEYGCHAQSMDHGQSGETDDEGIERDSAECEEILRNNFATFDDVLEECSRHIGVSGLGSESHYKAVCRALVAEALELSSFLDKLSDGTVSLRHRNSTSAELSTLDYSDWARLWIQLIRELRRGVQLKKVDHRPHTGVEFVEYALTPYEMLMDDIRSRRYKLKRVIPPEIPARIQRDAHDAILEFIRSRPPLKSAAARKLAPRQQDKLSPREHLLECIKSGNVKLRSTSLTKSPFRNIKSTRSMSSPPNSRTNKSKIHYDDSSINHLEEDSTPNQSIKSMLDSNKERKLIKVDFSALAHLVSSDSEDDFEDDEDDNKCKTTAVDFQDGSTCLGMSSQEREGKPGLMNTKQNKNVHVIRKQQRRHTIADQTSLSFIKPMGLWKQSRRQSMFKNTLPTSDCLTLTLQELIHIRSVLTKAEIESLPVEGNFKEDVENRKVCFLCMKTRFGIFGPWGQECKMCQRTVCSKCCTKMRMPTEHLSQIPVVALSPNVATTEPNPWWSKSSWGSAPSSPQKSLTTGCPSSMNSMSASYHGSSTVTQNITRAKYSAQMAVCLDCKTMVLQEIKTSRVNRSNLLRHLTLDLSSVY